MLRKSYYLTKRVVRWCPSVRMLARYAYDSRLPLGGITAPTLALGFIPSMLCIHGNLHAPNMTDTGWFEDQFKTFRHRQSHPNDPNPAGLWTNIWPSLHSTRCVVWRGTWFTICTASYAALILILITYHRFCCLYLTEASGYLELGELREAGILFLSVIFFLI